MIVYLNGRFVRKEDAGISPDDRGFLFADGAYEAIRSYNGKLFELARHLQRLERSLRELRITGASVDGLAEVISEVTLRNGPAACDTLVYVQVTRGAAERSHSFPGRTVAPTVYISEYPVNSLEETSRTGAKVILVPDIRWERCDIKSVQLLPNVLANQTAKERGADEAVFVRDGEITEGTHTNFCAIFDDRLVTHPLNHRVLDGITRRVVLELCRETGIEVDESPIREDELRGASELMILGTTFEVMPVVRVGDMRVAGGVPGPITELLREKFRRRTIAR